MYPVDESSNNTGRAAGHAQPSPLLFIPAGWAIAIFPRSDCAIDVSVDVSSCVKNHAVDPPEAPLVMHY